MCIAESDADEREKQARQLNLVDQQPIKYFLKKLNAEENETLFRMKKRMEEKVGRVSDADSESYKDSLWPREFVRDSFD
jgi:hypothetical protein